MQTIKSSVIVHDNWLPTTDELPLTQDDLITILSYLSICVLLLWYVWLSCDLDQCTNYDWLTANSHFVHAQLNVALKYQFLVNSAFL